MELEKIFEVRQNFLIEIDENENPLDICLAKTRTSDKEPLTAEEISWWNFDGSSTGQAEGTNSEVYLKPVALFNDPFTLSPNKLVFCETFNFDKNPSCSKYHRKDFHRLSLFLIFRF